MTCSDAAPDFTSVNVYATCYADAMSDSYARAGRPRGRCHEVREVLKATGEFKITGGHEEMYSDRNPGRLTRAGGTQAFSGGIDGVGRIEWLMCYRPDRTADFVGLQEVDGAVDGRRGTFVLTSVGSHDGVLSRGTWTVVAGTGKGELSGIVGNGRWKAGPGPRATFELTYEFA